MTTRPTKTETLAEEDDAQAAESQADALPVTKLRRERKKSQPKRAGCLSGSSMMGLAGDAVTGLDAADLRHLAVQAMASLAGTDTTELGPSVRVPTSFVLVYRAKKPIGKGEMFTTDNVEPILIPRAQYSRDMIRRITAGDAARVKIDPKDILAQHMVK